MKLRVYHSKSIAILTYVFISLGLYAQEEDEVNVPENFYSFVNEFVMAVKEHDYDAVYEHLEKGYKKEQGKFLGNKKQLIDELLSGHNEVGDWMNPELTEIIEIWMVEYDLQEDDTYVIYFEVELERYILTVDLHLKTGKKKKKWGFIGAMG